MLCQAKLSFHKRRSIRMVFAHHAWALEPVCIERENILRTLTPDIVSCYELSVNTRGLVTQSIVLSSCALLLILKAYSLQAKVNQTLFPAMSIHHIHFTVETQNNVIFSHAFFRAPKSLHC